MGIKTYIINLKHSVDRRSLMEAQLVLFPELDYTFLEATDARILSEVEIYSSYSEDMALKVLKRPMVRGEIGVALSQLRALKNIESNHPYGLVMEDDLLISPYFSESLIPAVNFIDSNEPRIVLFTPIPQYSAINPIKINNLQNRYIFKLWNDACYAACYLINKAACQTIINEYPKVFNVIDNWGYFLKQGTIDIRAVVPHVVAFSKHGLSASTINLDNNRDSKITATQHQLSISQRFFHKLQKYYFRHKFKVINSKNVWYNHIDIIQSDF